MPGRRVPTEALEARGAFKSHADRKRKRANEPKPEKRLSDPPAYFDESQRASWAEIVDRVPWLRDTDFLAVERLSLLTAELRSDPRGFSGAKHQTMGALEGKLGLSPADRSRVSVPQKPKVSELAAALDVQ